MVRSSGARKALSGGLLSIAVLSTNFVASTPALAAAQGATGDGAGTFDTGNIQKLINGFAWYALAFSVTGIFVSAALWALGSKGQNPGQELTGKRGIMVCLAAAFIVGGLTPFMGVLQGYAGDVERSGANVVNTNGAATGGGAVGTGGAAGGAIGTGGAPTAGGQQ